MARLSFKLLIVRSCYKSVAMPNIANGIISIYSCFISPTLVASFTNMV